MEAPSSQTPQQRGLADLGQITSPVPSSKKPRERSPRRTTPKPTQQQRDSGSPKPDARMGSRSRKLDINDLDDEPPLKEAALPKKQGFFDILSFAKTRTTASGKVPASTDAKQDCVASSRDQCPPAVQEAPKIEQLQQPPRSTEAAGPGPTGPSCLREPDDPDIWCLPYPKEVSFTSQAAAIFLKSVDTFAKDKAIRAYKRYRARVRKVCNNMQSCDVLKQVNINTDTGSQGGNALAEVATRYSLDPAGSPHVALRNLLRQQGIDSRTAEMARRTIIAFFETPAQLRFLATYIPGTTEQVGKRLVSDGSYEPLVVNASVDAQLLRYYESRRSRVEKVVSDFLKHCNEDKPSEAHGFFKGVASIYMPSRVYFGYIHVQQGSVAGVSPTTPFALEDDIDYDVPTCGFDEESSGDTSSDDSEESSPDDDASGKKMSQQAEECDDIVDPLHAAAGEDDQTSDDDLAADSNSSKFIKKREDLARLAQYEDQFVYPVPAYAPDTVSNTKPQLLIRSRYVFTPTNGKDTQPEKPSVATNLYGNIVSIVEDDKCFQLLSPIFIRSSSQIDGPIYQKAVYSMDIMTDELDTAADM